MVCYNVFLIPHFHNYVYFLTAIRLKTFIIKSMLFPIFLSVLFAGVSCSQKQEILKPNRQLIGSVEVSDRDGDIPVYAIRYVGPTSSEELRTKLYSNQQPSIVALSAATKESLISSMIFSDGLYRGMRQKDANIQSLYDNNFPEVLSAILGAPVTKNNNPIKHNYKVVNGGPNAARQVGISECDNCFAGAPSGCCEIPGNGCCDYDVQ